MPTSCKKDTKGCYCQWGSQKKYYYKCGDSSARARARAKADKQGRAARAGGYKGATEECQERGAQYPYKTGFKGA